MFLPLDSSSIIPRKCLLCLYLPLLSAYLDYLLSTEDVYRFCCTHKGSRFLLIHCIQIFFIIVPPFACNIIRFAIEIFHICVKHSSLSTLISEGQFPAPWGDSSIN